MTAIEAALGVILFVRSKSGFRATVAGEAAIAQAQQVERDVLRLEETVQTSNRGPSGPVRIVTNFWMITHFLVPNLQHLLDRYPNLQIRAIGETRERSLSRREAELALWFEMGAEGPEIAIRVGEISYAVHYRNDLVADELGWVTFWDEDTMREPMRWLEASRQPGEAVRMTASDASSVTAAIRSGIGKGLIPICLGEHYPELARFDPVQPQLVRALHAIIHPDMIDSTRIQATLAWLREIFENQGRST